MMNDVKCLSNTKKEREQQKAQRGGERAKQKKK